jgi:hypothetical protein
LLDSPTKPNPRLRRALEIHHRGLKSEGDCARFVGCRWHRLGVSAAAGTFSLDDARPDKLRWLGNLGRTEATLRDKFDPIQQQFLNGVKAAPFTPKEVLPAA